MNNEPVAWMCPTGLEYKQRATDFMYNDALYDTKLNWIPLYTHPVKELTDEEIYEIIFQHNQLYQDGTYDCKNKNLIWFAKAILRKARE